MSHSKNVITYNTKGDAVSFNGPKAVNVYKAATLASALGLAEHGIGISRHGPTKTQLLNMATTYTGVKYKRGEYTKAKEDMIKVVKENKASPEIHHILKSI